MPLKTVKTVILLVLLGAAIYFLEFHLRRQEPPPRIHTIRVLESARSPYFLPLYLALNLNFFKEQNLEVSISTTSPEAIRAALNDGRTDIALCGLQKILFYPGNNKSQPKLFAVQAGRDGSFLLTRKAGEEFQWEKIKDKTIIGGSQDDSSQIALEDVIRKKGLSPYIDVTIYNNIPDALRVGAFRTGTGNYIQLLEPEATIAELKGFGQVTASVGEAAGDMIVTAYAAMPDYMEKNPEAVQGFVNAVYKAQLWLSCHTPEEAAEAAAPSFAKLERQVLQKSIERYRSMGIWKENPVVPKESYERFHSAARQAGEIPYPVLYETAVINDFANKAVETVVYVREQEVEKKSFWDFLKRAEKKLAV